MWLNPINLQSNNIDGQLKSSSSLHINNIEFQLTQLPCSNKIEESEQKQNTSVVKMPWKFDITKQIIINIQKLQIAYKVCSSRGNMSNF